MPLWLILVIFGVLLILGVLQAFPDVAANPSMLLDQIPGL